MYLRIPFPKLFGDEDLSWNIKCMNNSMDQNTVYLENFEAKAHDLVTSNGRYVVVGGCWVLLALLGAASSNLPNPPPRPPGYWGKASSTLGMGVPQSRRQGGQVGQLGGPLGVGHRSLHSGSCPLKWR